MNGRIFGLDAQLLADVCIQLVAIGLLFFLLSYLLFNPARELLAKRRAKVEGDLDDAAKAKADAEEAKKTYEGKLAAADKEVDLILSDARQKGQMKEAEMVAQAKEESARILARAEKEVELEKEKVKDDVKHEIIAVASQMAAKITAASMDEAKQEELLESTLAEMGDDTWRG
ncbi:MAG: F0F1 ATP synthase subunit B [Lachnospiraceae bacterium]|nr:F0F1 ATP synthase subunit B [Lachnospiraceae bacterium]